MPEIVLDWTAAAMPVWLRTEAKQNLYPLIVWGDRPYEYQTGHTKKRLFEQLGDQADQIPALWPS